jgi:hypothetical protein
MTHEDQVALEILSEAIMKIDEELGLDAVAADDRLVIRALIRYATAIAVGRWKDAAAVIEDLVAEGFREAEADLGGENHTYGHMQRSGRDGGPYPRVRCVRTHRFRDEVRGGRLGVVTASPGLSFSVDTARAEAALAALGVYD